MKNSFSKRRLSLEARNPRQPQAEKSQAVLILIGVILLLQDLLAENVKHIALVYNVIKYVDETVPLFLLVLLALSRIAQGRFLKRTPIDIPLILFLAVALVSSIAAAVPAFVVISQFLIYIKAFIVFYLLYNLPLTEGIFQNYKNVFFWVGIVFFIFGLVDLVIPETLRRITGNVEFIEYRSVLPSVKSLFIHPGVFGWFMSFLALFCLGHAILKSRPVYVLSGVL